MCEIYECSLRDRETMRWWAPKWSYLCGCAVPICGFSLGLPHLLHLLIIGSWNIDSPYFCQVCFFIPAFFFSLSSLFDDSQPRATWSSNLLYLQLPLASCSSSFLKLHPPEAPSSWSSTLLKLHPPEAPSSWSSTLLKLHPPEALPSWSSILLKLHPPESVSVPVSPASFSNHSLRLCSSVSIRLEHLDAATLGVKRGEWS